MDHCINSKNIQSPRVGIDIVKTGGTYYFCIAMFIPKKNYIIIYNIYNLPELIAHFFNIDLNLINFHN